MQIQRIAQCTGHNAAIFALSPYDAPHQFLSGGGEGWIVLWDMDNLPDGRLLAQVEGNIFCMQYLQDTQLLVVGTIYGGVYWVDLQANIVITKQQTHSKGVFAMLRVGEWLYTAGGDGSVVRWDIAKMRNVERVILTNTNIRTLQHDNECNTIWAGASDGKIYALQADTLSLQSVRAEAHEQSVFALCWDASQRYLWSGGRDAHLKQWSMTAQGVFNLHSDQPAHHFTINDLQLNKNLQLIASASRDKTIKLWDSHTGRLLKVVDTIRYGCHVRSVNALLWCGNRLVSASDDRSLMIWDIQV